MSKHCRVFFSSFFSFLRVICAGGQVSTIRCINYFKIIFARFFFPSKRAAKIFLFQYFFFLKFLVLHIIIKLSQMITCIREVIFLNCNIEICKLNLIMGYLIKFVLNKSEHWIQPAFYLYILLIHYSKLFLFFAF